MSSSNWCLLTCIQISQETGQVVWYSHLFQDFTQFIVIHTVKGFGIVNKAEIDVDIFLERSCFFDDPADVGNLVSGSSAFSKTSLNMWKFKLSLLKVKIIYDFFPTEKTLIFTHEMKKRYYVQWPKMGSYLYCSDILKAMMHLKQSYHSIMLFANKIFKSIVES